MERGKSGLGPLKPGLQERGEGGCAQVRGKAGESGVVDSIHSAYTF